MTNEEGLQNQCEILPAGRLSVSAHNSSSAVAVHLRRPQLATTMACLFRALCRLRNIIGNASISPKILLKDWPDTPRIADQSVEYRLTHDLSLFQSFPKRFFAASIE